MSQQHLLDDVDGIVREYLTWRGFGNTLQALSVDIKEDTYSGLSSKRLVEKLFMEIDQLQVDHVFLWWDEAVAPLLLRVEEEVAQIGRSFRDATFRLLIVTLHKHNQQDLILHFFSKHWAQRVGNTRFRDEWKKQWFSLPYLTTSPERDRYFQVFFSQEWKNTLKASLESFLNAVLVALPLPRLVALGNVRDFIESMRVEIETLKLTNTTTVEGLQHTNPVLQQVGSAMTANDETTTTINAITTTPQQIIGKRPGAICSVRYSPSCELVAACGRDAICVVWPVISTTSKPPRLFCNSTARCLDWFDDGLLCVGTMDHSLHLWRPGGAHEMTTLRTAATLPHILDCSVNNVSVACAVAPANAALPGEVQLWNIQSEKMERVLPADPQPTRTTRIQFNHNGTLLCTGAMDGMVRVFDVAAGGSAIMGWQASKSVGAICLAKHETSVFCLDVAGTQVVEYSVHKVGEVLRKFDLIPNSNGSIAMQEVRASLQRLAVVLGDGRCVVMSLVDQTIPVMLNNIASADWDESTLVCGALDGTVCKYQF